MIYANINLFIGEKESICDQQITLYRGDKNVQIRFILKDNRFTVVDNTYAQLVINRPDATSLLTECSKIEKDEVILTISEDMIDEIKEIGTYQFQIRLYDDNMNARVTLPPCYSGLIIERPIATEGESLINLARINDAIAGHSDDEYDIFDDNNLYLKTNWEDGDLISDTRMNKIENALYSINEKVNMIDEVPTYTKPTISIALSKTNIEHSKTYDISISTTFIQNDAGGITGYKVYKNNSVIFENSSISSYTDTITMQHGENINYKAEVTYANGPIKNTMMGIPYPSTSIKSGSITSSSTVKAYALSYYGVIDGSEFIDTNGLTSKLRTSKSDTVTISLTNQRIIYMYPKSFGNLTSIKDANNFDYINSYTLSNATVNDVEYNIYILTDPVTINNFKQIFN